MASQLSTLQPIGSYRFTRYRKAEAKAVLVGLRTLARDIAPELNPRFRAIDPAEVARRAPAGAVSAATAAALKAAIQTARTLMSPRATGLSARPARPATCASCA
mgnify:CR=1 FL=1